MQHFSGFISQSQLGHNEILRNATLCYKSNVRPPVRFIMLRLHSTHATDQTQMGWSRKQVYVTHGYV
jgi:hypothetical protein